MSLGRLHLSGSPLAVRLGLAGLSSLMPLLGRCSRFPLGLRPQADIQPRVVRQPWARDNNPF